MLNINLGNFTGTPDQKRNILNQAMLDAFNAGGGIVSFYGQHDVSAAMDGSGCLVARSGVHLVNGSSVAALRLVPAEDGKAAHLIDATMTNGFKSIGVDYDGNKHAFTKGAVAGYHAVRAGKGCNYFSLRHAAIKNGIYYGVGIQLDPNNPVVDSNIALFEVEVKDCGGWSTAGASYGDGIDIKYALSVDLDKVTVSNSAQRGIDLRGRRITVSNIKSIGNANEGLTIRGYSDSNGTAIPNAGHMLLSNIHTESNGSYGVAAFLDSGATVDLRLSINGHLSFSNGADGIYVSRQVNRVMASISGAIYKNNGASGARLEADNVHISGVLKDNTKWGIDQGNAGSNHSYDCVFGGNGYGNIR